MAREVETSAPLNSRGRIALPDGELPLLSPATSQLGTPSSTYTRRATRKEQKEYSEWIKQRTRRGLPPWANAPGLASGQWSQTTMAISNPATSPSSTSDSGPSGVLKSSKTVRQWADSYCSSPKLLKEFIYTKVLYGWDIVQLESAIRSTIALAPYHGDIEVSFTPINSKIYIRPSNQLSRCLSNAWLKFLSIILFIFPFIWLFKQFHGQGGGKWEVCGGAYALKRWVPMNRTQAPLPPNQGTTTSGSSSSNTASGGGELPSYEDAAAPFSHSPALSPLTTSINSPFFPLPSTSSPSPSSHPLAQRIIQTPSGPYKLIGQREGEWFRYWEPVILRSVLTRYQSSIPLTSHSELYGRYAAPGSVLEGYHDAPAGSSGPVVLDGYNPVYGPSPRNHW